MGRKNLLQGLMDGADGPAAGAAGDTGKDKGAGGEARAETTRPRYSGGAIGAVSQSIAELKSRALLELDPFVIESAGVQDRLDDEDADHDALVASIRDYGQQVPVLVRPHPKTEGRYQVVYGRRRVKALRDLGQPVRALVRQLDDRELMLAQGQENNARKDLSFIEKASFARQMRDMGYGRVVICAALHVDKTVISRMFSSRMFSIIDRLEPELIEVIGSAPSVGRDRWLALADLIEATNTDMGDAQALVNLLAGTESSDRRFEALSKALSRPEPSAQTAQSGQSEHPALSDPASGSASRSGRLRVLSTQGDDLGHVVRKRNATVVTLAGKAAEGFDDWLVENLSRLHQDWKSGR